MLSFTVEDLDALEAGELDADAVEVAEPGLLERLDAAQHGGDEARVLRKPAPELLEHGAVELDALELDVRERRRAGRAEVVDEGDEVPPVALGAAQVEVRLVVLLDLALEADDGEALGAHERVVREGALEVDERARVGRAHDAPPPLVAAVAAPTHLIVFQIWAVDGAWRALL